MIHSQISFVRLHSFKQLPFVTQGYLCIVHKGAFSTFGAHPGSIDVRVRFRLDDVNAVEHLGCAPVNRSLVHLERVVWGSVQVNSGTVHFWCERNRTKSQKWIAINLHLRI